MANDTHPSLPRLRGRVREGAAAYFYSRDIGRIWRVAGALEYGIVCINRASSRRRDRAVRRHEGKAVRINHALLMRCYLPRGLWNQALGRHACR
jgi:hypothetical protein